MIIGLLASLLLNCMNLLGICGMNILLFNLQIFSNMCVLSFGLFLVAFSHYDPIIQVAMS